MGETSFTDVDPTRTGFPYLESGRLKVIGIATICYYH